jgi:hypothetical protein
MPSPSRFERRDEEANIVSGGNQCGGLDSDRAGEDDCLGELAIDCVEQIKEGFEFFVH